MKIQKLLAAATVAIFAALVLAVPASASSSQFGVTGVFEGGHPGNRPHSFIFHERLVRHHDTVGHDKVRVHRVSRHKQHVHIVFDFGSQGKIKAEGDVGGGDKKIPVIGGTRRFNGVGGKVIGHNIPGRNRFRYTFYLVK